MKKGCIAIVSLPFLVAVAHAGSLSDWNRSMKTLQKKVFSPHTSSRARVQATSAAPRPSAAPVSPATSPLTAVLANRSSQIKYVSPAPLPKVTTVPAPVVSSPQKPVLVVRSSSRAVLPASASVSTKTSIVITERPLFLYPNELGFYVAIRTTYDLFYDSRINYYIYHNNCWYYAYSYKGPWMAIVDQGVPEQLRKIPLLKIREMRDAELNVYLKDPVHYRGKQYLPKEEVKNTTVPKKVQTATTHKSSHHSHHSHHHH